MKTLIKISLLIPLFIGYSSGSELPSDVKQLLSKRNDIAQSARPFLGRDHFSEGAEKMAQDARAVLTGNKE